MIRGVEKRGGRYTDSGSGAAVLRGESMQKRWGAAQRGAILEALALLGFISTVIGIGGYDLRAGAIFGGLVIFAASVWGLSR